MCTSWHTDRYLGSLFRVDEPVRVIRIKKTITEFVWKNSDKGQPAEIVPQLTFLIWFNMPLDSNPIQTHSNPFKPTKHSLLRKKCRKVWRFNIYYVLLPWHLQVTQLLWATEPIEFGSAFVSIYGKAFIMRCVLAIDESRKFDCLPNAWQWWMLLEV